MGLFDLSLNVAIFVALQHYLDFFKKNIPNFVIYGNYSTLTYTQKWIDPFSSLETNGAGIVRHHIIPTARIKHNLIICPNHMLFLVKHYKRSSCISQSAYEPSKNVLRSRCHHLVEPDWAGRWYKNVPNK